ncbi:hypothetical protein ACP275_06G047500 [Erythranthe tilingii]
MASKTSTKPKFSLSMINLVCCILTATAAAACDTCTTSSFPSSLTVPESNGGSGQGGQPPEKCPMDAVKLGVCANLLGGLVKVVIGRDPPTTTPCCSLLAGLVDLEAALCLCLAVKTNVLGIVNLNVPLSLSLLLNACGRTPPIGFTCS